MEYAQFINGRFVPGSSSESFLVLSPSTQETIAQYPLATTQDVIDAIDSAKQAYSSWRKTTALERATLLRRVAEEMRTARDQMARQITLELGKPYSEAQKEVDTAAEMFEWAAEEARRLYGRVIPARAAGIMQTVHLEPMGVVGAFSGWNAPAITPSRKISAALAAGCTIVIKPSEETAGTALCIAHAVQKVGIPAGVVNMVFGNPAEIADLLCESDDVAMITFTGGTDIGKGLGAKAAKTMKRAVLELGGHAPVVVWNDVDLDQVISPVAGAKYRNAGQVCTSPTRFLVHADIFDDFCSRFATYARNVVVGDPFDAGTQMGPLKNQRRRAAIQGLVANALENGATLLAGGKPLDRPGFYYEPTVLAVQDNTPDVCRIEPFGPVAVMIPINDIEQALHEANALPFGLASYVFTNDMKVAHRLTQGIESGVVCLNDFQASLPETPFGGYKDSGLGSEGGIEGLREFVRTKYVRQGGLA